MSTFPITLILALTFGVIYVIISVLIYHFLHQRNEKVSFLWLRVLIPWYVYKYKKITEKESGRIGLLFYGWIISINLALLMVVITFLL